MSSMQPVTASDLSHCDVEPIHIPGTVQPHGVVLACGLDDWGVTHASQNAEALLGVVARDILGRDLATVLGAATVTRLAAALDRVADTTAGPRRAFQIAVEAGGRSLGASVHASEGRRIVELELLTPEDAVAPLDLVGEMLRVLQRGRSIAELCDATVSELRRLIGFDRVMIYRFLHDASGQVIAEARRDDQAPLLHLRYPASDIPRQARALYVKSWVRLIEDVAAAPVSILALAAAAGQPLDLSYAALRSVSPIHVEYLRNMKVGASLSVSIVVGGELWGLIACHHGTARRVPANLRAAAELLGQVFSLQIQTVEGIEAYVTMRAARALLDKVVAEFPIDGVLAENLAARLDQIAAFVASDGIGLWIDGTWRAQGLAPRQDQAGALAALADARRSREVFATHALAADHPPAASWEEPIAGMLAVPLSHTRGDYLFFFRREVAQTVDWGGDPRKAREAFDGASRLTPRKSFDLWREEVRGQAAPWTSRERLIAETLRVYLLEIVVRFSEVILEERRQAQQRQRLAIGELNHRVKGTLELVQSLVARGAEDAGSVPAFVRALEGRIKAIALAHDAVSADPESELAGLVETALAAHVRADVDIDLAGPRVRLDARAYTVLALVVHELAANAAAHGALAAAGGRLIVRWMLEPDGQLAISWDERPAVAMPALRPPRKGLGLLIIERNVPHALGGRAEVAFEPTGLHARFTIPRRFIVAPPSIAAAPTGRLADEHAGRPLDGYAILVVDDQMLAALALESELKALGAGSVELAGTTERALEIIETNPPDCAVVDIDLAGDTSLAVADALAACGIPFILAGHQVDRDLVPPAHADIAIAGKPYAGETVAALLKEALMPHLIRAVLTQLL